MPIILAAMGVVKKDWKSSRGAGFRENKAIGTDIEHG
jgi:hypothetical protein